MMDIITSIAQIVFVSAVTAAPIGLWFFGMIIDVLSATLNRNSAKPDNWLSGMHFAGTITHIAAMIILFQVYGTQAAVFSYFSGAAVVYAVALAVVNAVKEGIRARAATLSSSCN